MFPFFNHYPGSDLHEIDLAYILKLCANLEANTDTLKAWKATHEAEYGELKETVDGLVNNLVDVIVPWDSSIAYHIFSIVEYQGTNYIAVKDVPVGAMITDTEYWQPANTVVEQINAIGTIVSDIQTEKVYYITPEDFGAAGDGVTDDTAALQAAFTAACTQGKQLRSFGRNKIYLITSQIDVDDTTDPLRPLDVNFGGATIRAGAAMESVLCFNNGGIHNGDTGAVKRTVAHMVIDCNEYANRGIWHVAYRNLWLEDVTVLNCCTIAIHVVVGAVYAVNIIIDRRLYNYYDTIGIQLESTDNKFVNVRIRDSKKALNVLSASNFFINVHAWLINSLCVPGSVYAYVNKTYNVFAECYADTFEKAWELDTTRTLELTACRYFINTTFYNDTINPTIPTVIYLDDNSNDLRPIKLQGCIIQSDNYYTATGHMIKLTNLTTPQMMRYSFATINNNNYIQPLYLEGLPDWRNNAPFPITKSIGGVTSTPDATKNINDLASIDGFYILWMMAQNSNANTASMYMFRVLNGAIVGNTINEVYKGSAATAAQLNSDGTITTGSTSGINIKCAVLLFSYAA